MPRAMSRKRKKQLTQEAARLLCEGKSIEEAMKETGLAYFDVQGMDAYLHSKRGREWATQKGFLKGTPTEESTTPLQEEEPSTEASTPLESAPASTKPRDASKTTTLPPRPLDPGEVVVAVEGIPSGRRIQLTAKSLMYYDWFRSKYNYDGNLSTFINETIEDFFKSRNWTIKVVKEEIIS